jgi:hypothetical protein
VISINGKVSFSQPANPCPQLFCQQPRLAGTGWYYQLPEVLKDISFQKEAPYWRTLLYSFGPLKGYIQKVTLIFRLAGNTSYLFWYAKTIGSQSTVLLVSQAPCCGTLETLVPKEVTSIESVGKFLTASESLPLVIFSASPGLLILSDLWGGMSELLAPCWEESTYRWRIYIWELLCMASTITLLSSCSIVISWEPGNKSHHPQSPMHDSLTCYHWSSFTAKVKLSHYTPWRHMGEE